MKDLLKLNKNTKLGKYDNYLMLLFWIVYYQKHLVLEMSVVRNIYYYHRYILKILFLLYITITQYFNVLIFKIYLYFYIEQSNFWTLHSANTSNLTLPKPRKRSITGDRISLSRYAAEAAIEITSSAQVTEKNGFSSAGKY